MATITFTARQRVLGLAFAAAAAPTLVRAWHARDVRHQPEAGGLFGRDGFVYPGGGGPDGRVAKVDAATGAVAWSFDTHQGYQPSHPVSNGRVVVFGTYSAVGPGGEAGGRPSFVG